MAYVMLTDRELTAQQTCYMACAACNMWQHSYCSLNYHTLTGLYGIKVGVDEKLVKEGESSCKLNMYYLINIIIAGQAIIFYVFGTKLHNKSEKRYWYSEIISIFASKSR